jgi:hypothetical protein
MMKPEPERDAAPAAPKVMFSMDGFKNSTNGMILLFLIPVCVFTTFSLHRTRRKQNVRHYINFYSF